MTSVTRRDRAPSFGQWLSAMMAVHGYQTDAQLAEALGTRDSTVSRWRRDAVTPDIPALRKIAELFQTPLPGLLVLCGHLKPEEIGGVQPPDMPTEAPDPVETVVRREVRQDRLRDRLISAWRGREREEAERLGMLLELLDLTDEGDRDSEELILRYMRDPGAIGDVIRYLQAKQWRDTEGGLTSGPPRGRASAGLTPVAAARRDARPLRC